MRKIEFEIKGIAPLLMNNIVEGKQPSTEKESEQFAPKKAYRDSKGYLAIPAHVIKASIREASADIGKKMESKKRRELVKACLFIEPDMLSLGKKEYDIIDKRPVFREAVRGKKTMIMGFRPLVKEWKASGTIWLVDGFLTNDFVKEAFERAGIMKGVLSYRPEFGRFIVTKFKEVKE